MNQLSHSLKTERVLASVAAGTTVQNCTVIDTAGYDGVRFTALFGALTSTQNTYIYAQQDTASNMAAAENIASSKVGPLADNASNKCLILEICSPQKRYIRCVVNRGTANAVIDGVIADLYGAGFKPATNNATVYNNTTLNCPANGTI